MSQLALNFFNIVENKSFLCIIQFYFHIHSFYGQIMFGG